MALPFALPVIAGLKKRGLQIAMVVLTAVSLVAKFAYSYDLGGWAFFEGALADARNTAILLHLWDFFGGCPGAASERESECFSHA